MFQVTFSEPCFLIKTIVKKVVNGKTVGLIFYKQLVARNLLPWNMLRWCKRGLILTLTLTNHSDVDPSNGGGDECRVVYEKITILFSANVTLYLGNDTRYNHSYSGMWIGNCTQSFKWYHFQRPLTIPNTDFKFTPLFDSEYLRIGTRYRHSY